MPAKPPQSQPLSRNLPGTLSRRRVLSGGLGLSGVALAGAFAGALRGPRTALGAVCRLTPEQTEGPFYPPRFGLPGNDLLAPGAAPHGEPIALVGRVTDARCRPLAGAVVEIWQADAGGHYAHPDDAPPPQRDADFRYWGRAVTDAEGRYRFRTLLPGAYRMGMGWRTPHIHVKVRRAGEAVLTTQMYFAGQPRNAQDSILRSLGAAERAAVIVAPEAAGSDPALAGLPVYRFDLGLG